MPEFRFSMINGGTNRVEYVEIPEEELKHGSPLFPPGHHFNDLYRQNVIQTRLEKWAVSKLNLSWEEVKEDEKPLEQTQVPNEQA